MQPFWDLLHRVRNILRMRRLEEEMRGEMLLHIEHRAGELRREGVSADEARRLACIQFGKTSVFQEQGREALGYAIFDALRRDFLIARRQLSQNPVFSLVTIVTIAMCLGLNGAAFAMLRELILQPLPFPNSERLVEIYNTFPKVGIAKLTSNVGQYLDFRVNAPALDGVALWKIEHDALARDNRTVRIASAATTPEIFDLLGLRPVAGRFFGEENNVVGSDRVVLLTESYWANQFGRDPHVIGDALRINGVAHEILGVIPESFENLDPSVRLVRPLAWDPSVAPLRAGFASSLFGRLHDGFNIKQANAQLASLETAYLAGANVDARNFAEQTGQKIQVDTLQNQRSLPFRKPLLLAQTATLVLLLIAFTNVFNLFAARANSRVTEFRIRSALGASAPQIVRQIGVEAGVVCTSGVVGGIGIASLLLPVIPALNFSSLEGMRSVHVSWAEIGVMIVLGVALWLIITCATSLQVFAAVQSESRRADESRTFSVSLKSRRIASALVSFQIALAFVLSISAVLLVLSFLQNSSIPAGLDPSHVISLRIDVPASKEGALPLLLEEKLRQLQEVESCVVTSTPFYLVPPFKLSTPLGVVHIRGRETAAASSLPSVFYAGVSANYAKILGLKIITGRWFSEADISSGKSVVIDERFQQMHFHDENPVGKWIVVNRAPPAEAAGWMEVIGVVRSVPHNGAEDQSGHPFAYLSRNHTPLFGSASILAKTHRNPQEIIGGIRDRIRSADPDIPIYAEGTLTQVIEDSSMQRRIMTWLVVAVASVSLFLAALGIYGTFAYDVSRRKREIGIRSAVGASRAAIVLMFLKSGSAIAGTGILAGVALALILSQTLAAVLYKVSARDFETYAGCSIALLLVSLLSCFFPAWRASRMNALVALRAE